MEPRPVGGIKVMTCEKKVPRGVICADKEALISSWVPLPALLVTSCVHQAHFHFLVGPWPRAHFAALRGPEWTFCSLAYRMLKKKKCFAESRLLCFVLKSWLRLMLRTEWHSGQWFSIGVPPYPKVGRGQVLNNYKGHLAYDRTTIWRFKVSDAFHRYNKAHLWTGL